MSPPPRRRNPNCSFHPEEALGCSDLALPVILFNSDLALLIVLCELVSRCYHDHLLRICAASQFLLLAYAVSLLCFVMNY